MITYPLASISLAQAKEKQFKLVDIVTRHFEGEEILTRGDLGLVKGLNKPKTTLKVEQVLAEFFHAESAVLVRGSGTAAIQWGLFSVFKGCSVTDRKRQVLVHKAPIYPTTKVTLEMMDAELIEADYNDLGELQRVINNHLIDVALVQYTRQKIDDRYQMSDVIEMIATQGIPIVTDDNYAIMKVSRMGTELGADLSAFSAFKLLGPEGIGCVVGKKKYIDPIIQCHYSGGGQVQGHEALDLLKGLIYAPVALAIQAEVNDELLERLNQNELSFVKRAFIVNAQSKVILIELQVPIAEQIIEYAAKLGALPYPVGAESKYEFCPLFYRISGTFRATDPTLEKRMIRINPNRSGAETILRILKESYHWVHDRQDEQEDR